MRDNTMSRELIKVNDHDFKLVMKDEVNRHYQEKYWSKEELKDNYKSVKLNLDQTNHSLAAAKKNLDSLEVTLTPEEEKILLILQKAVKRDQYDKLKLQYEQQLKDRDMYASQVKELEKAIPELKRSK